MDKIRRINTGNKDYQITNKPNKALLEAKTEKIEELKKKTGCVLKKQGAF